MALDTIIILAALAVLLVVLLLRRGSDEAIGRLHGAIQVGTAEMGEKIANFTIDQARAANAGQAALSTEVAALQRALIEAEARQREALAEQIAALRRDTAQTLGDLRTGLAEAETRQQKALVEQMTTARNLIESKATESRLSLETKLKEMREANENKLAEIQKSVNEQLQSAVEKQMNDSFARVIDQFTAVQKAMADVQAVTGQIGDLKRLFTNVKTRGGWGEAQVKALLDDILPAGSYEENWRPRPEQGETVEFAILMPQQGEARAWLPIDAKFPVEDYDRLLLAAEAGDVEAERAARRGLEARLRGEAQKIAQKYICPPRTSEFAVLYLPTDGLYAEAARMPGLIEAIFRAHRVSILGPSLLPTMLTTIKLGHVTLALSANAEAVRELLGATKTEMEAMDGVLKSMAKQVGTVGRTIERAQVRTRAVARRLRGVDSVSFERARDVLEIEDLPDEDETT